MFKFFWKRPNVKIFLDFQTYSEIGRKSEIGGNASLALRGWTPLKKPTRKAKY